MKPSNHQKLEKLRDGSTIIIRAIRADDNERFVHAFKQLSRVCDFVVGSDTGEIRCDLLAIPSRADCEHQRDTRFDT
jgi:hypothetical protein